MNNKEKHIACVLAWRKANKDKVRAYERSYYLANREKYAAQRKRWRAANPGKTAAYVRDRQVRKLKATPKWADQEVILKLYETASSLTRLTGIKYVVDHIVPLKSKFVCGLHTEANLQILTHEENSRKRNKMPGDIQ